MTDRGCPQKVRLTSQLSTASQFTELLLDPPRVTDPAQPDPPRFSDSGIAFQAIHFTYAGQREPLFCGLDLRIEPGQKVGLVGPSGGGKSTLTRLLLRFADIDTGSIRIGGQDISRVPQADVRSQIAYVPQDPLMFHRTEKNPELTNQALTERARAVGIGAVKYADLSTSRTRDYIFDVERMVTLNGDTGVYLQYAYARINSILRRAGQDQEPKAHPSIPLEPAERALELLLDGFGDVLNDVTDTFELHRLCGYLHDLAVGFTTFYEKCPVLKASTPEITANRLLLCQATAATLRTGMSLLGLRTPERL